MKVWQWVDLSVPQSCLKRNRMIDANSPFSVSLLLIQTTFFLHKSCTPLPEPKVIAVSLSVLFPKGPSHSDSRPVSMVILYAPLDVRQEAAACSRLGRFTFRSDNDDSSTIFNLSGPSSLQITKRENQLLTSASYQWTRAGGVLRFFLYSDPPVFCFQKGVMPGALLWLHRKLWLRRKRLKLVRA